MMIHDLVPLLQSSAQSKSRRFLLRTIKQWTKNDEPVSTLQRQVNQHICELALPTDAFISAWQEFESNSIMYIAGMTMNERFYAFGLLKRWDTCKTETQKLALYRKVHASPTKDSLQ